MRTLSVKLTKNFENISKPADKSRFFSELHSPLEIKTTRIILSFLLFFIGKYFILQFFWSESLFKTNVERMQR